MSKLKKPKPPKFGAYKAEHGADWKLDYKAGAAAQKAANLALHKAKKGTAEYDSAKQAFDAAYAAIPHKAHKKSGFGKLVEKLGAVTVPVLPGKKGIQLTGGAKHVLGSKVSKAADTALQIGGGAALAGAAADVVTSGFMGGGVPLAENSIMPEQAEGTDFLDSAFGWLNKAGQYAQQGRATIMGLEQAFGGGGDDGGSPQVVAPQAPAAAPEGGGMPKWVPWAIGGAVALVLLFMLMGGRGNKK